MPFFRLGKKKKQTLQLPSRQPSSPALAPEDAIASHITLVDSTRPEDDAQGGPPSGLQDATRSVTNDSGPCRSRTESHADSMDGRAAGSSSAGASTARVQINLRAVQASNNGTDQETPLAGENGATTSPERERNKIGKTVNGIMKPGKAARRASNEVEVLDVLFENQRGFFFFGIPLYSDKSLLNLDPGPWVDGRFQKSRVDITNAQVPDPSWEWDPEWKSWYVDMSGDVDEEGWEYSFAFHWGPWHGTHPFFHSWVRRRKWMRKRVRKHPHRPPKKEFGRKAAFRQDSASAGDFRTIWGFLINTGKMAMDREKITPVRDFIIVRAGESPCLTEEIRLLIGLFIFQDSRRKLLQMLNDYIASPSQHQIEGLRDPEGDSEKQKRRFDNLLSAVKALEEEIKKLEYWSDIKGMGRDGEAFGAMNSELGWDHGWQEVDASGPARTEHVTLSTATSDEEKKAPSHVRFLDGQQDDRDGPKGFGLTGDENAPTMEQDLGANDESDLLSCGHAEHWRTSSMELVLESSDDENDPGRIV